MEFIDKNIAERIAEANKTTIKKLGLRFDKVAVRLLISLKTSVDIPKGRAVLWTITAPIKLPAKTEIEISQQMNNILESSVRNEDFQSTICQNQIHIRVIDLPANQVDRIVGFVHNPESSSKQLLDLATQWLLGNQT